MSLGVEWLLLVFAFTTFTTPFGDVLFIYFYLIDAQSFGFRPLQLLAILRAYVSARMR